MAKEKISAKSEKSKEHIGAFLDPKNPKDFLGIEEPKPEEFGTESKPEIKTEAPAEEKPAEKPIEKPAEPKRTEFAGPQKSQGDFLGKPKPKRIKIEKTPEMQRPAMKLFGRWSTEIEVRDLGLKPYINLSPMFVPYSAGRTIKKQFWKSKKSIVERLVGKLMVPGHKGKKHYWTSGPDSGKINTQYNIIKKTFEIIEQRTKQNPVEVFVRALEVSTPREGIATIEYGGVRYPKAADLAPQRRLDLTLRWMVQGAFVHSVRGKKHISETLADEIIAARNSDASKSNAVNKRIELERQAGASR